MTKNLLSGSIPRQLTLLALPLLLGNILQQLYNAVDSIIIGRFVGSTAFAAVGVAGTVMNLFIFVISGVCIGVSTIFAQLYGAKDFDGYRREAFLALVFGCGFAVILTAISLLSLPGILRLIQTPPEVDEAASAYLRIIFIGFLATYLYNLCAAVLRSVGNTKTALTFLAVAVTLNTGLDFLFVTVFRFGVAGAAAATVIAQLVSVFCSICYIGKKLPFAIFRRRDMIFDRGLLSQSIRFSLAAALQQSSLYVGKLLVQGAVNSMGTSCIAAFTAASRIEGFANSFGDSGGDAISIFTAQNIGAKQPRRAKKGLSVGLWIMVTLCLTICTVMFLLTPQLVSFFINEGGQEELRQGTAYLRIISFFYLFCFTGASFVGYFRGSGLIHIPVLGTAIHITLRVIFSYLLIERMQLPAVAAATGIGWIVVACLHISFYLFHKKRTI